MGLINLRNALMTGKRLPYDAEIEFLESTGTQYVNTGIKPGPNTRVEAVFAMTTFTANCGLFGARGQTISNNLSYNLFIVNYAGQNKVRWDWSGNGVYKTSQTETSTVATYNLGVAGSTITRDGVFLLDVSAGKTAIDYPIYIFNFNNVGTPFSTGANARFWSVKIYDGQTIVFDAIPVRKGTVGYLYDRVSGALFGNAGTGDFVLGPDVVPVEYLQGCLGGYVDTGIKSLNTISTDISFSVVNPTHDSATGLGILLYGNGTTWEFNSYAIFFQNASNQPDYKSLSSHGHNNILVQTPQNSFDCNVGVACDGTSTATVTTTYNGTTTSRSIRISAIDGTQNFILLWNRLLADNTVITRLKSAEFISGGATIAKFVPVRVGSGSSWEGAMMDTLTRRIYRNAGAGAFGYGNDLKYPIPAS